MGRRSMGFGNIALGCPGTFVYFLCRGAWGPFELETPWVSGFDNRSRV